MQAADMSDISKENHFLVATVTTGDSIIAENSFYFLPSKDLNLPKVIINKEISQTNDGYLITLTADKLAKNVFLSLDGAGVFSNNYFDLLPRVTETVFCKTSMDLNQFKEKLNIKSLSEIREKK